MITEKIKAPITKIDQLKSLLPYLRKYRPKLVVGFVFIVLTNIMGAVQPLVIKRAIDDLELRMEARLLLVYAGAILGLALLEGVFMYFMRQSIVVVSRYIEYDLRNDFFAHLQKMSLRFYHNHSTGELMARATNDLNAVRSLVGPGIMYFSNTIVMLTWTISVMIALSPKLTIFALIPLPLIVFTVYKLMNRIHDTFRRAQAQFGKITGHAQENISGIRVVKAYGQEDLEKERFGVLNEDYISENLQLAKYRGALWASMTFLTGLGTLIVLWFGGYLVSSQSLTIGSLAAFFTLLYRLTWPMISIGWVINITQQGIASMGRINEILNSPVEITDDQHAVKKIDKIFGKMEFRNVSFAYNGAQVLHDISFTLQPGTTLAIVGHTGSGKTTLLNLVPRLLEPIDGEILIDSVPVQLIPLKVLRENIGYVPQETFLFSDSIKENIKFGVNGSDEAAVKEAANVSQIYNEVMGFPNKFETVLGERGINLSGGQKQRTAISRAVIKKPPILLFDDTLSAVDTYTEEEILKRLRQEMHDSTSIIVSHRISTIRDANKIIVLNEGEIVERGTHESLIAKDGIYAELHRKQLLEESLEEL